MTSTQIDPITTEVIGSALASVAEEMGAALIRSAYSTNIKERRDCSCAVFDSHGELIALAEHIPIHLGSMQGLMGEIAQNLKDWGLESGDAIIANDPYLGGGSHLPDITLIQPVFYQNELVAFVANIAHWADVGGRLPGVGTAGDSTELLQEGLRIPPNCIVKEGQVRNDILDLLLINMRGRQERLGDFRAQLASLRLGERRLHEFFNQYGTSTINSCIARLQNYSEKFLRSALREIHPGTYSFTDYMDDDGISDSSLPIRVAITISQDPQPSITFDFNGTASQAAGGINMVWQALMATVFYAVKAVFAPKVPTNAGFQRPINVHAAKGSLVNAYEPAPVGGRTDTCQRVVDTIMGALSHIVPHRVVAASNGATTAIIFAGNQSVSGKDFIYVEALGGGMGARAIKDGMDGVQVHITNTSNLPIEAMELEYPLRVLRYKLVSDTGGPGKFRGGLAIRKDIQALTTVIFSAHADRHRISPWGLNGGMSGSQGRFLRITRNGDQEIIPSKVSGVQIQSGEVLSAQTAGGGGFGSPLERDPCKVVYDVTQRKVSLKKALQAYGVVLTNIGELDMEATNSLRERLKNACGD